MGAEESERQSESTFPERIQLPIDLKIVNYMMSKFNFFRALKPSLIKSLKRYNPTVYAVVKLI